MTSVLVQTEFSVFSEVGMRVWTVGLSVLLSALMVSNVPFPSFKEVNWRAKGKAWILLIPVVMILALIQAPEISLFAIGYTYLISSLGWAIYLMWVRDRRQGVQSAV